MTSVEGYARPATRWRLGIGAAVVVVLLALAVTVGIGIMRGSAAPTESVVLDEDRGADEAAELYVHVFGAVSDPGLYVLREGARVVDAVAAAGGMLEGADEAAVNLARQVGDGEQLYVPTEGESAALGSAVSGAGPDAGDGRINLNTATEAELDTLPRIGPAMARRILEWRDANGRFTSLEDLLAVPGIGDKMLESLRTLVTL
ncbi:ComEA family DNA-binding protein [Micromonospora sp. DT81.3]|uniref:ComEA family DNA-binding protein n=1 Tax=Actinomycetes TaxID=1760 RepID=UPI003CFA450A